MTRVGFELHAHGDDERAEQVFGRIRDFAATRGIDNDYRLAYSELMFGSPQEGLRIAEAALAESRNSNTLGVFGWALVELRRTDELPGIVEEIRSLRATSWWPAALAAARGDAAQAVAELRATIDAGGRFYTIGNPFLHYFPPFGNIADDPQWQAMMAPRD